MAMALRRVWRWVRVAVWVQEQERGLAFRQAA